MSTSSPQQRSRYRGLKTILIAQAVIGSFLGGMLGAVFWLRAHGVDGTELASELRPKESPRFDWQSIDKKHWQAASGTLGESSELTDAREGTSAGCPTGMVRVKGAFRRELHGGATGEV